jgi:hypothetical protein
LLTAPPGQSIRASTVDVTNDCGLTNGDIGFRQTDRHANFIKREIHISPGNREGKTDLRILIEIIPGVHPYHQEISEDLRVTKNKTWACGPLLAHGSTRRPSAFIHYIRVRALVFTVCLQLRHLIFIRQHTKNSLFNFGFEWYLCGLAYVE